MSEDSLKHWSFVGGSWSQDGDGIITAPTALDDRSLAVFTLQAYADFEADFEFRWDVPWTNAGFVFAAHDALNYHVLNFPVVGQHYRREHFWGVISKVDESGFIKAVGNNKRLEQIGGVPSEIGLWHTGRLVVEAGKVRAWVDGRPLAALADETLRSPGHIGLMTYRSSSAGVKSSFRNIRVDGRSAAPPLWDASVRPRRSWLLVTDTPATGCTNIVRAANDDLLVGCQSGLLRSSDHGRTWAQPEPLPFIGALNVRRGGQVVLTTIATGPPCTFEKATSDDHGRSWSSVDDSTGLDVPETATVLGFSGTSLVLDDGTLVWFVTVEDPARVGGPSAARLQLDTYTACIRSTDEGRTWSTPVAIDGPNPMPEYAMIDKDVGSETASAHTRDGKIVAFVRNSEPTMWECWSHDGGLTWRPAARGPFANYASINAMVTTRSGVILLGGRFPGIGVQASYDHGMTWQCTEVGTAIWAQGSMIEVEDDVVLYVYGGPDNPRQLRGQLLRVTPDGLQAVID